MKSRKSIAEWRKRVGDAEADRISKQGTTRGTKFHKYTEDYLNNLEVKPKDLMEQMSKPWQLFEEALPYLDDINNIHALEAPYTVSILDSLVVLMHRGIQRGVGNCRL